MKRLLSDLYLNLLAGAIALSILAISAFSLWTDRQNVRRQAEQSSRNLLTTLSREINDHIGSLDPILLRIAEDIADKSLLEVPPQVRHRVLFDRVRTSTYVDSALVVNEDGNAAADAASILPRRFNASDRDYFTIHRENSDAGFYLSRPIASRLRNGDPSMAVSRRLSHPDGRFAGVVVSGISLSRIGTLFSDLDLGPRGSITLFRDDGIVLTRQPHVEGQIGQDLGATPNVRRFLRERSGSFEGTAAFDQVHRLYVFGRVDGLPLVLAVSKSMDDLLGAWRQKAIAQGGITLLICSGLVALMLLLRRELRRRTGAEAKLARLASTDDLTGLPNRRAFREAYERERRHAIRSKSWLSVLYVDADFFKQYNDLYGHGRGDDLLRAIAGTLAAQLQRPRDMAARYGGEEFTVLLPETDPAGAERIAEDIRKAIMLLGVEHRQSLYGIVTVSIGAASKQPSLGTVSTLLLEAADAALYQAKEAGRNCVRHWRPDHSTPAREPTASSRSDVTLPEVAGDEALSA